MEVVSELTTSAFLALLRRFIASRRIPTQIYSDCGTNFQVATTKLRHLLSDPVAQNIISNTVPSQCHFNTPAVSTLEVVEGSC